MCAGGCEILTAPVKSHNFFPAGWGTLSHIFTGGWKMNDFMDPSAKVHLCGCGTLIESHEPQCLECLIKESTLIHVPDSDIPWIKWTAAIFALFVLDQWMHVWPIIHH